MTGIKVTVDKRRVYVDFSIVDEISKIVDIDKEVTSLSALNFRSLFKDAIGAHHLLPCRVCGSFRMVCVSFTNADDPHEAVSLCIKHHHQFKAYYSYSLGGDMIGSDTGAFDLCDFPLSEKVVESLIEEDGTAYCEDRVVHDAERYPLTVDLSFFDFFIGTAERRNTIQKITRGWMNSSSHKAEEVRDLSSRIIRETERVCGVEYFPFDCPWEKFTWR